ncbi:YfhO family protein [Slackia piriformis]|uniref:YfhO family protein n=1 Tax=Slackia piriformis TaxID=626934 RepID=UPI0029433536|nr:YfhO family protein [Slackia piriformis]
MNQTKNTFRSIVTPNRLKTASCFLLIVALACATHAVFLPQFFNMSFDPFTYYGGDATAQMVGAVSFLERSILEGNLFWSWEYGLGGDLYEQFSYYYSTSPFFYAMFLIKLAFGAAGGSFESAQEWRLIGSILKQILCMTLMFALVRQEGKRRTWAVLAAAVYGCSPWYIDNSFAFDFMTDAMIWLPAIVLAFNVLKRNWKAPVQERKRLAWLPLCLVMALCLANNFYFAYISLLFCIVFALIFAYEPLSAAKSRKDALVTWAKRIASLAGIVIVSLGLAAIAFFPSVLAFLGADRTQVTPTFDFFAPIEFFGIVPEALFFKGGSYFASDSQTYAFPLFILLALAIDYRKASSTTRRKSLLAAIAIAVWMIPLVSSAMNGFSYPSNRWCYLVVFAVAYAIPDWLDAVIAQKTAKPVIIAGIVAFVCLCWFTHDARIEAASSILDYYFTELGKSDALMLLLQLVAMALLYIAARDDLRAQTRRLIGPSIAACLLASMLFAMPFGPYSLASGYRDSSGAETIGAPGSNPSADLQELFEGSDQTCEAYALLSEKTDSNQTFFRSIDEETVADGRDELDHLARYENRSWLMGTYPVSVYNSLIGKDVSQWIKLDHHVSSTALSASHYRGFDHRLFIENAWGVQYKFNTCVNEASNLYGYHIAENNPLVYENEHALGIDLWYDSCLPQSTADAWTYAQKDAALMQTAVVDDSTIAQNPALNTLADGGDLDDTVYAIDITPDTVTFDNCALESEVYGDGVLAQATITADENARISIALPKQSTPGEYLLEFTAVNTDGSSWTMTANGEEFWTGSSNHRWKYPTEEYVLCFPAGDTALQTLDLELEAGTYRISDLRVEFNSYQNMDAWTNARNACNLENLKVNGGNISGTARPDSAGILALSVPYSNNWKCTVNGEEHETFPVNGIFTGIALDQGEYEIELHYTNKAFIASATISCITALALAIWAGAVLVRQRKQRRTI